jgi:uncharacterized protein YyaL (SSP411 family)
MENLHQQSIIDDNQQLIKDSYKKLSEWIDNNPYTYDVSDIKATTLLRRIIQFSQKNIVTKKLASPFFILSDKYSNVVRKFLNVQKNEFAQAKAISARAYLNEFTLYNNPQSLKKAISNLKWLEENTSPGYEYFCWGQPFDWQSRTLMPAYTPRATVTSQAVQAFLDAYEIIKDEKYLEIAISACHFFIAKLNWNKKDDNTLCFSYTSVDKFHIHNSNMLVSSGLLRTWKYSRIENFRVFGISAMQFTLKHQNKDGSWYYWAPPDKVMSRVDNYHTGFILESLVEIKNITGSISNLDFAIEKGVHYYIEQLFQNDVIPKLTNKSLYPIDIQSCAQAIITFSLFKNDPEIIDKARGIANWTIHNMQDNSGYFYYRIYKDGKIDKTAYMRWSESWMLRALSNLIKVSK